MCTKLSSLILVLKATKHPTGRYVSHSTIGFSGSLLHTSIAALLAPCTYAFFGERVYEIRGVKVRELDLLFWNSEYKKASIAKDYLWPRQKCRNLAPWIAEDFHLHSMHLNTASRLLFTTRKTNLPLASERLRPSNGSTMRSFMLTTEH